MSSLIATVEADFISTLKAIFGTRVKAVEALPGDWDDDTLKRVLRLVPGIFISFAGGPAAAPGNTCAQLNGKWLVYAATGHVSGEAPRRLGDAQQIGAYELIELAVRCLHGHTVPNCGTAEFESIENLFTGTIEKQGVTVYGATFTVPMTLDTTIDPSTLDDFITFEGAIDTPPFQPEEYERWIQRDYSQPSPASVDVVTLPQT